MATKCPKCGGAAHTRSSREISGSVERYQQCQSVNCSTTFVTLETFVRYIVTPQYRAKGCVWNY